MIVMLFLSIRRPFWHAGKKAEKAAERRPAVKALKKACMSGYLSGAEKWRNVCGRLF